MTARLLSNDIRLLGDTLGDVLRAHGGETLFRHVEDMRGAAKTARDQSAAEHEPARAELGRIAASLSPDEALEVVRAFTLYFQLVNLAEDVHRTRELRRREAEGGPASVAESLHLVAAELADEGVEREEVMEALRDVSIAFVFTAHPTEARRRTTERLLAGVRGVLEDLDRRHLTPTDRHIRERRLRAAVEALWEHSAERTARPEVLEEVKTGLWYLRNVLLDAAPRLYRRLRNALMSRYGDIDADALPMPVSFGSWMGSDRDGNPLVNDAVTERTAELHRFIILDRYLSDLDALVDPLAAVDHRLPDLPSLGAALERAAAAVPEVAAEATRRNPTEPLRRLLTFMRERIERTRSFSAGAYPDPDAFLADLRVLRESLRHARATALPDDLLLDVILRVRCFGFTLAALDVREDSRVHRPIVAELLGEPDYPGWAPAQRIAALGRLSLPPAGAPVSPEARRLLDLFGTVARLQARFGEEICHTYIISMTETAADAMEVVRLAELHHLAPRLDVVPLLETGEALASAGPLLEELLSDPGYREHLGRRGDVQELLVGYSDSMKQSGILASRVLVHDAQRAAAAVCRKHGVTLRLFHGRGGSVSRGGGPTYRAIRAFPPDAFSGRIKITEQGETRAAHFANPDLAIRYLEQTLGAALAVRLRARASGAAAPGGLELLREMAEVSRRAYRELVEHPALVPYFLSATPFEQIARLNIASRPAKRPGREGLELADLRAIPWVFSWSQSRHVLTGWYGVGSALHAVAAARDAAALRQLYGTSPFFCDLLDNVQMALAKGDLPIAARYAGLCEETDVRDAIFGRVRDEHGLACDQVLAVTAQRELLEEDPVLRRSIDLRNPYVDPLSYLQVEALRRARASDGDEREAWDRVARVAVQGIAAGLRNTG